MSKAPVIREDDGELLGFIGRDSTGWTAQTIFGYVFARTESESGAEQIVRDQGLAMLQGLWNYFDKDDKAWHPCVLKEVFENKVIVIRTNEMGYQTQDAYKRVTIINPTETKLVKV